MSAFKVFSTDIVATDFCASPFNVAQCYAGVTAGGFIVDDVAIATCVETETFCTGLVSETMVVGDGICDMVISDLPGGFTCADMAYYTADDGLVGGSCKDGVSVPTKCEKVDPPTYPTTAIELGHTCAAATVGPTCLADKYCQLTYTPAIATGDDTAVCSHAATSQTTEVTCKAAGGVWTATPAGCAVATTCEQMVYISATDCEKFEVAGVACEFVTGATTCSAVVPPPTAKPFDVMAPAAAYTACATANLNITACYNGTDFGIVPYECTATTTDGFCKDGAEVYGAAVCDQAVVTAANIPCGDIAYLDANMNVAGQCVAGTTTRAGTPTCTAEVAPTVASKPVDAAFNCSPTTPLTNAACLANNQCSLVYTPGKSATTATVPAYACKHWNTVAKDEATCAAAGGMFTAGACAKATTCADVKLATHAACMNVTVGTQCGYAAEAPAPATAPTNCVVATKCEHYAGTKEVCEAITFTPPATREEVAPECTFVPPTADAAATTGTCSSTAGTDSALSFIVPTIAAAMALLF